MDRVLALVDVYQIKQYTDTDVNKALMNNQFTIEDYAALISPAAMPYLEEMARKATMETKRLKPD